LKLLNKVLDPLSILMMKLIGRQKGECNVH